MIKFRTSDGGRAETRERSDCTVRALAIAAKISYSAAHDLCSKYGRKFGKRFKNVLFIPAVPKMFEELGLICCLVRRTGSLSKFIRDFPTGIYYVRVSGHVFSIIDGIVYDMQEQSGARRIKQAWKIS